MLFSKKKKDKSEIKEEKPVEKRGVLSSATSLPEGGDADSYRVILSPHVTEKGTMMSEQNKYVFKIAGGVNKVQVKKAVESLYKVEAAKVSIFYAQSKSRRMGGREGRKAGFKKAIVTLKEGSKIDIAS